MYQSSSYPEPLSSPPPLPHNHIYPPSSSSSSFESSSFLSPPSPYSSSLPLSYLQRSSSTLSLHRHVLDHHHHHSHLFEQPEFFDFQDAGPMRRVFSTGDLQGMNSLQPLGGENCNQEGGGAAAAAQGGRVGRYNAEERKERIERYRSKRNQRNFHKKITYACRKTLADSRPRVRGRFAKNGEAEAETEAEAGDANGYNNSFSQSGGECHGWMQGADEDDEHAFDDDLWTNFLDVFSTNNFIS